MKKTVIVLFLSIVLMINIATLLSIFILSTGNQANSIGDIFNNILDGIYREHTVLQENVYQKDLDTSFVSITDDFVPDNRQELLNIYYTVFSSGMDAFYFYCSKEYKDCIDDVIEITSDDMLLSSINNFVHTFNSYKSVRTSYSTNGKVMLKIDRVYSQDVIDEINLKIDEIYPSLVKSTSTQRENIKRVHDYIINNARYDSDYVSGTSIYSSSNAYGPLFEWYAICSGYTDLMSLFLDRMGITNEKISNDKHVWNYLYLNGQWLHLDLTWDDPITSNGKDVLRDDYFLITTNELLELDTTEHTYNQALYSN